MSKEEIEAKVEIIAKDYENLIHELENAEPLEDGRVLVPANTKDIGVIGYMGYGDFRCFCDELIRKYLRKKE